MSSAPSASLSQKPRTMLVVSVRLLPETPPPTYKQGYRPNHAVTACTTEPVSSLMKSAIFTVKGTLLDYGRQSVCRWTAISTGATESEV